MLQALFLIGHANRTSFCLGQQPYSVPHSLSKVPQHLQSKSFRICAFKVALSQGVRAVGWARPFRKQELSVPPKLLSVLLKLISQAKSATYVETEDFQSSAFIIKNVLKLVTILYLAYFPHPT